MIVDASVILSAFLPDKDQAQAQGLVRDHVVRHVALVAPTLLLNEVTNAVVQARRQGRLSDMQARDVLIAIEGLGIALRPVTWQQILPFAQRFDRSAYDAAYLALAEMTGEPLITGDRRLYNAVHEYLDWVVWIGDYQ
ncbi:MAG: type II toxin-antitoxin system VapC family toxin [Chloroflexota bacterium]|nr:type II toxin-antitoxin system VapC family toxin [Chloroflexota bacterium]